MAGAVLGTYFLTPEMQPVEDKYTILEVVCLSHKSFTFRHINNN